MKISICVEIEQHLAMIVTVLLFAILPSIATPVISGMWAAWIVLPMLALPIAWAADQSFRRPRI